MTETKEVPIRVAQIMGKWNGGGVEAVIMNYYKHIDRNKIQFDFICDEDSTRIPKDEIEKMGGKVIIVSPYQKLFKYIKELRKIFRDNKYKIVHSNISTLSIFPLYAAKKENVPVRIAHCHSTSNPKEWKRNILKNILRPFSKIYATDYFACSELAGRYLFGNNAFNQGKVTVINNAIEIEKFKFNEEIRNKKRKELNIDDDTLVVGHVGRFVQQKNHKFLIGVFNEIIRMHNNSKLILAGEGPLKQEIEEKVEGLSLSDKVLFLGQRKDTNELYQAFDVLLLPSLYEGLPVVGIEAQVSGLKCIFSKKMTKETKILESTEFVELKTIQDWVDKIKFENNSRLVNFNRVKELGFDINIETKKYEKYIQNKKGV